MNTHLIADVVFLCLVIAAFSLVYRRCVQLARRAEYQKIRAEWYKDGYFGSVEDIIRLERKTERMKKELDEPPL